MNQEQADALSDKRVRAGADKGIYRQCSLDWHFECSCWGQGASWWTGGGCQCKCHRIAAKAIDKAQRKGRLS